MSEPASWRSSALSLYNDTEIAFAIGLLDRALKRVLRLDGVPQFEQILNRDGIDWGVVANEAEVECGDRVTEISRIREILDLTTDSEARMELEEWAQRHAHHLPGRLQLFSHLASLELSSYSLELSRQAAITETLRRGNRLPISPALVSEDAPLAQTIARIWRLTSDDSPIFARLLLEVGQFDPILESASAEVEVAVATQRGEAQGGTRRAVQASMHSQSIGEQLEKDIFDVLSHLMTIEPQEVNRARIELRRQRAGAQYGTDIILRATSPSSMHTYLVECKNYRTAPTVYDVAGKWIQAAGSFDNEPIDHWILVSPHMDPNNDLDRMIQKVNAERTFPFNVQVWSPQSGIRNLLACFPSAYESVYGAPPDSAISAVVRAETLGAFRDRLTPVSRMPINIWQYLEDQRLLVRGGSERPWLEQLHTGLPRKGFDSHGRPIPDLIREIIAEVSDEQAQGTYLLTAEFGEGKSFLTVMLCEALRRRALAEPRGQHRIPLRFHLRDFRHAVTASDFLQRQLAALDLNWNDWHEMQRLGAFVVLDGMDEMSIKQDLQTTRQNLINIESLLDLLDGVPVLVTSRPSFLDSTLDRELFLDRLRRPRLFTLEPIGRQDVVGHLANYAKERNLGDKLARLRRLYDPIGLASKALFLEMIKAALPDLPEDDFSEMLLYESYVQSCLMRKVDLLRDPGSSVSDSKIISNLEEALERLAVEIHVRGEGAVDLKDVLKDLGGAAYLLWKSSAEPGSSDGVERDATSRIATRSLLRRLADAESTDEWIVDFAHRSIKEYFVARAIMRASEAMDSFSALRDLLKRVAIQPEILRFCSLATPGGAYFADTLASLVMSARCSQGNELLGPSAVSLFGAIGGRFADYEWRNLRLDGALLRGANLAGVDLQGTSLRGADLGGASLMETNLANCDLTGANLGGDEEVVAVCAKPGGSEFLCVSRNLAVDSIAVHSRGVEITRLEGKLQVDQRPTISVTSDGVLAVFADGMIGVYQQGMVRLDLSSRFRISQSVRHFSIESGNRLCLVVSNGADEYRVAYCLDLSAGTLLWSMDVESADMYAFWEEGVAMYAEHKLTVVGRNILQQRVWPFLVDISVSLDESGMIVVCGIDQDGTVSYFVGDGVLCESTRHAGGGSAVALARDVVVSGDNEGGLDVGKHRGQSPGTLVHLERRLRCHGAHIRGVQGEREMELLLRYGGTLD